MGDRTKTESVKVAVRVRPFNRDEIANNCPSVVRVAGHQIVVDRGQSNEPKSFAFDYVYPPNIAQATVFDDVARPIVDSVIAGYNGTIFAYGQTGTGKTFTMEGVVDDPALRGIMPNAFHHIFDAISKASKNIEYLVRVSFIEIYNDDVYDLLNKETRVKMQLKEGNGAFYVKDVSTFTVNTVDDTMKVLRAGQKMRQTGATKMNPGSSRSHSIFTITVETCEKVSDADEPRYRVGKLNLVDLAGSERQKKTEATGDRLTEAKNINLSLSALGNVINALTKPNSGHVPFRDSKLTRLLQDSLGGNTRTVMIAAVGPADTNMDETMSTLRYAHRAKGIMNIPVVNEDPKDAMLRKYQEEIDELKKMLDAKRTNVGEAAAAAGGGVREVVVEKVIVKHVGVSEEDAKEMERRAREEMEAFKLMHEEEKQKILASKSEAEQAALLYEIELQRSHEQSEREREEIARLEKMLAEKETHLLQGGQELEAAQEQRQRLEETERCLQEQLEKERCLQADLEEAEEAELYMNEQYSSRQEELEKKTKKLKKLWAKYKERVEDLNDIHEEHDAEREDLLETIRDLSKQVTVQTCLLGEVMSPANQALIESHAHWDPYTEDWSIDYVGYGRRPTGTDKAPGHRRLSTYERIAALVDKDARGGGTLFGHASGVANAATLKAALQRLKSPLADLDSLFYSYNDSKVRVKTSRAKKAAASASRSRRSS